MAVTGQSLIRSIDFDSPIHGNLPVEVVERSELMRRVSAEHFAAPQRPLFHSFLLVQSGHGSHTVDFVEAKLRPGRMVRIRPGQVLILDTRSDFAATFGLSQSTPPDTPNAGSYRDLDHQSLSTARALINILRNEQQTFSEDEPSTALMRSLFEALCLVFERATGEKPTRFPVAYSAFLDAIERALGDSHSVREIIRDLGYAERTITRACQKVTGRTARGVLNDRLVLEAMRMLAHTEEPTSTIAAELGFSEATNFHKFFVRHTGKRPIEFRSIHRRDSPS